MQTNARHSVAGSYHSPPPPYTHAVDITVLSCHQIVVGVTAATPLNCCRRAAWDNVYVRCFDIHASAVVKANRKSKNEQQQQQLQHNPPPLSHILAIPLLAQRHMQQMLNGRWRHVTVHLPLQEATHVYLAISILLQQVFVRVKTHHSVSRTSHHLAFGICFQAEPGQCGAAPSKPCRAWLPISHCDPCRPTPNAGG